VTYPSPSQQAALLGSPDARRLAAEVSVIWRFINFDRLPWLRERFVNRRHDTPDLMAYTINSRGRIVRAFYARLNDLEAYASSALATCPIEAVDPLTIVPGKPAEPAHPKLLRLQQEARQ
jgi:hypothetical protein